MDSDGSPKRQSALHKNWKFHVLPVIASASIRIQGGKRNEQERKSCCSFSKLG